MAWHPGATGPMPRVPASYARCGGTASVSICSSTATDPSRTRGSSSWEPAGRPASRVLAASPGTPSASPPVPEAASEVERALIPVHACGITEHGRHLELPESVHDRRELAAAWPPLQTGIRRAASRRRVLARRAVGGQGASLHTGPASRLEGCHTGADRPVRPRRAGDRRRGPAADALRLRRSVRSALARSRGRPRRPGRDGRRRRQPHVRCAATAKRTCSVVLFPVADPKRWNPGGPAVRGHGRRRRGGRRSSCAGCDKGSRQQPSIRRFTFILWHVHGSWTTAFVPGPHRYLEATLPDQRPERHGARRDPRNGLPT